jgi:hypothetical protein
MLPLARPATPECGAVMSHTASASRIVFFTIERVSPASSRRVEPSEGKAASGPSMGLGRLHVIERPAPRIQR